MAELNIRSICPRPYLPGVRRPPHGVEHAADQAAEGPAAGRACTGSVVKVVLMTAAACQTHRQQRCCKMQKGSRRQAASRAVIRLTIGLICQSAQCSGEKRQAFIKIAPPGDSGSAASAGGAMRPNSKPPAELAAATGRGSAPDPNPKLPARCQSGISYQHVDSGGLACGMVGLEWPASTGIEFCCAYCWRRPVR